MKETYYYFVSKKSSALQVSLPIGVAAKGYSFLFKETKFYKNIDDFIDFYFENASNYNIVNNYSEVIDFAFLLNEIHNSQNKNKHHHSMVYNDEKGFSFIREVAANKNPTI